MLQVQITKVCHCSQTQVKNILTKASPLHSRSQISLFVPEPQRASRASCPGPPVCPPKQPTRSTHYPFLDFRTRRRMSDGLVKNKKWYQQSIGECKPHARKVLKYYQKKNGGSHLLPIHRNTTGSSPFIEMGQPKYKRYRLPPADIEQDRL